MTAGAAVGIVLATNGGGTKKPAANSNTPTTSTATTVRAGGSPSNNTTATTQQSASTSPTSAPATSAQSQASDDFSDLIRPVVVSRSAAELNIAMPSIAVGPGGSVLVGSAKGTSWVWNQGSEGDWRELDNAASHDAKLSFIWSSAISPNGRYALTGSADGQINLWDLKNPSSGYIESWFVGNSVRSITYSANGEDWAAVTNRGEIYTGRGREFNQNCADCSGIATLEQGLVSVAFTADNRYLAVGGKNGLARLVSTAGQEVGYFDVPGNDVWVQGVDIDPTGRYLALATGPESERTRRPGWVAIYDLTSGSTAPFSTTTAHALSALSIDFSPDGKYVATGSVDGTVVLWGWQSGNWVKALTLDLRSLSGGRDCRVGEARFTLDGTGIAATCLTPSGAGFAVVWKIRN